MNDALKKECADLGIMIVHPLPHVFGSSWSYVGVFPPARRFESEEAAMLAALAHYRAIQPKLPLG